MSATILVAHPSPDLYGSDRQLLETVLALVGAGHRVKVALPHDGPLAGALRQAGAAVALVPFTVLRKALLTPRGLAALVGGAAPETARLRGVVAASGADLLVVNTVTMPWWPAAGRAAGVPVLVHVHEAESTQNRLVRTGLNAPLLAATRVVTNSEAARRALLDVQPLLARRTEVVHNGVPGPPTEPGALRERLPGASFRVALVARLSPRKGIDVALEAVALLASEGVDARLRVCGTVFPGYEWYEEELRGRASEPDLAGRVELLGYVHPTWPVLEWADAVIVPSRVEPFGNTAVEAMHAARPLVASQVQGLMEVVTDGVTGLLVEPDSPRALADALLSLAADPHRAAGLARTAQAEAAERFSVERYRAAMVEAVAGTLRG
ncbi:glycosyltransferase family 4 protein [Actinomyces howellii]|uniref:D-inositol-3-phosphate glycosyltransferase n=1 Tax=Actinomyces howellii TaxID=52771 RepID=A0A3S4TAZ7_9ACTO|nr:glycosyltransferase family 4 protein [Actinomyces howellii]VEG29649.1 D-inositol-3-phosphate glycosyltransferase [Actinomyces howellii]